MTGRRFFWSTIEDSGYTYANALIMYSLRLPPGVSSSLLCVRVRRESDNTTQDFGYFSGVVDVAGIAAFCGASRGFVTTWYDLGTKGYNVSQGTNALQPLIYNGSSFFTEGGKYYVDGSYQTCVLTGAALALGADQVMDKDYILSVVLKTQGTSSVQGMFEEITQASTGTRCGLLSDTRVNRLGFIDSLGASETFLHSVQQAQNTTKIYSFKNDTAASSELYNNGALQSSISVSGTFGNSSRIDVFYQAASALYFRGKIAEIVLRNDSSDMASLVAEQNAYYSIF